MKSCLNKKGSIVVVSAIFTLLLVVALMELGRIYYSSMNIMEEQNKKDAHMLSVIGLYVETLDQVSWINQQLNHIAILCSIASLIPQLAPIVQAAQKISMGLKKYQDFLLIRLKVYAPVLDIELRRKNNLSLIPNYHYVEYRRRISVDFIFFSIPGLIEFKSEIFKTACVKQKGTIINSAVCVDSKDYRSTKDQWFAPTQDNWSARFSNA